MDDDDRYVLSRAGCVPNLIVLNKSDLPPALDEGQLNGSDRVHLSAKTREGLDTLYEALRTLLLRERTESADDLILTNARQYEAIQKACGEIRTGMEALRRQTPHEMVLLDLYQALAALDALTGEVVTDDILGRIFSTFCVGK